MESTPMFILFATVSSVASMVSGQNIVKLEIIESINIVTWLIQVRVQTSINYYMIWTLLILKGVVYFLCQIMKEVFFIHFTYT